VSKCIERDCFIRQRVVENVMWVAQYFFKQFVINTVGYGPYKSGRICSATPSSDQFYTLP